MAAPLRFSDEQLREYLEIYKDDPQRVSKIATHFKVSVPAVAKRIDKLTKPAAAAQPRIVQEVAASVFDVAKNLERLHSDLWSLITDCEDAISKKAVYGEIRQVLALAKSTLETVYVVQRVDVFMDEVLKELEICDPESRKRILAALDRRITTAPAFAAYPTEVSPGINPWGN